MITSSEEEAQTPLVMVHRRVAEAPTVKPVIPEVGEEGVVIVAVPANTVQVPVPTAGVFPAKVAVVTLHKFWLGPASATVGGVATLMTTSSKEAAQAGLVMVQRNVTEAPTVKPVTPEVGEEGEVMVAVPANTVHVPVPTAGVLPARVAVVVLQRF